MPEMPQATAELFAEDVSAISWEELVQEMLPEGSVAQSPQNYIVIGGCSTIPSDVGRCDPHYRG